MDNIKKLHLHDLEVDFGSVNVENLPKNLELLSFKGVWLKNVSSIPARPQTANLHIGCYCVMIETAKFDFSIRLNGLLLERELWKGIAWNVEPIAWDEKERIAMLMRGGFLGEMLPEVADVIKL